MNSNHKTMTKQGFTLVELSFSLIFVGVLSLIIALIINDTIVTYRRGLTLNQVNTVGMDLVDDIRAAFQNSTAKSVASDCESIFSDSTSQNRCKAKKGKNLVSVTYSAKVRIGNVQTTDPVPVFGAICTGNYSYVWNSGYFFNSQHYEVLGGAKPARLGYRDKDGSIKYEGTHNADTAFKLIKIKDRKRAVCTYSSLNLSDSYSTPNELENAVRNPTYGPIPNSQITFYTSPTETINEPPVRLLTNDENSTALALYDLEVFAPFESDATKGMFYSASFVLGTIDGAVNIDRSGDFCATPDDYENAKNDYCSINKFNFSVQTTGEGK